jgi:DNA-binding response OmpR family regulator
MKNVLIVEDDEDIRDFLKTGLESIELNVLVASDGMDAWDKINSFPIDVVVTDYRMPNMDGAKLSRLINAKFPEIPIILISTYDPDYIGIQEFIHTFLAKPFNVDELIIKLKEILVEEITF